MADTFKSLSNEIPLALLPVRLEARYLKNELLVRIFPDPIHGNSHDKDLTAIENSAGQSYWKSRWETVVNLADAKITQTTADAEDLAAKEWLANQIGPQRALWVAKTTEPGNFGDPKAKLEFPEVTIIEAHAPMKADFLPERWVLRIYDKTMKLDSTHVAAHPIAEDLYMAPSLASVIDEIDKDLEENDHLLAYLTRQNLDWMVNFEKALKVGMAFRLSKTKLPNHIGALIVCGINPETDKFEMAETFNDHLRAHWYSDGLGFLPRGTPTNNSDNGRTNFSVKNPDIQNLFSQENQTRTFQALGRAALIKKEASLLYQLPEADIISLAFGLNFGSVFDRLDGANSITGFQSWAMHAAIGYGSINYYGREIIALYNGEKKSSLRINDFIWEPLHAHYNKWVRSGGHIPTLRIGVQPYGILPITDKPKQYHGAVTTKPLSDNDFYKKYDHYMHELEDMWLGRLEAPLLDPNATDGQVGTSAEADVKAIADVLGAVPNPVHFHIRDMNREIEEDMEEFAGYITAFENVMDIYAPTGLENYWANAKFSLDDNATDIYTQEVTLDNLDAAIDTYVTNNIAAGRLRPLIQVGFRPLIEKYKTKYESTPYLWDAFNESGPMVTEVKNKAGRQRIPNLAGSTFSKTITPIEFRLTKYDELESLSDLLSKMIFILEKPSPSGSPDLQLHNEAPLLFHLFHQTYLNYPPYAYPVLVSIFKTIQNKLVPALEDENLVPQISKQITLMMQEVLGLLMHRLDAWVTSRAAQGLAELRHKSPRGLSIGGYGWLLDLRPSNDPPSEGFIHSNSMNSATTAAVLRSGWAAYGTKGETKPLSVNLSSERVRGSRWILEGIRNGQNMSELLGARFERYIHDMHLDKWLDEFRTAVNSAAASGRAVTALVDGLALARAYSSDASPSEEKVHDAVESLLGTVSSANVKSKLKNIIERLSDNLDACSDILMAQTVHSLVQGDIDSAAGALSATGGGDGSVPDLSVVKTPREAQLVTHRIIAIMPENEGFKNSDSILEIAEPRLTKWLSDQLPSPSKVGVKIRVKNDIGKFLLNRTYALSDFGYSTIEAVQLISRNTVQTTSRIARLIRAKTHSDFPDVDDSKIEVITAQKPSGKYSLDEFGLLATAALDAISTARSIEAKDFDAPGTEEASISSYDENDLQNRLNNISMALDTLLTSLASTKSDAERIAIAGQLTAIKIPGALALAEQPTSEERFEYVISSLGAAQDNLKNSDMSSVEKLRKVISNGFPILPLLSLQTLTHLSTSIANEFINAELNKDQGRWWRKVSKVHKKLGQLADYLELIDAISDKKTLTPTVAQLAHTVDKQWAAISKPNNDQKDRLCLYVISGGASLRGNMPVCGLVFDAWTEGIPRENHQTGIAYHFNSPSSRAPQNILLSVLNRSNNYEDSIFEQLIHTLDLMKIRTVGPDRLKVMPRPGLPTSGPDFREPAIGHYMPSTFLPDIVKVPETGS